MLGIQHGLEASSMAHEIQLSKPAVQRLVALCNVNPNKWAAELIQWSRDSQSFQQHNWLSCWKLYWPGFDAWSMGAMLLQILEIEVSIPGFKLNPKIIPILVGLCKANPAERMDALEALSALTDGSHAFVRDGSDGAAWVLEKQRLRSSYLRS